MGCRRINNKGGYAEDQQLQQPKKRSLGRVSEMQDGWLLTLSGLWWMDGRESRADDVRTPISVLPGN